MKLTSSVIALASIIIVHVKALEEVSWGKTSPILILPAIFSITNASAPGGINLAGFQMAEAFKCAVQQLNASQLIPGLQIKAQVADSGSGTDSATRIAAFATRYLLSDKFYTFVFGGGNNYADAATANQLLKARGVSLMQYFPSGSNIVETTGIQSDYNLLRSYPPDALQTNPMIALLQSLKITSIHYVAFSAVDPAAAAFLTQWKATTSDTIVCIPTTSAPYTTAVLNAFIVCLKSTNNAKIAVFGQPDDVVAGMKALQAGGAIQDNMLLLASNTWGTDNVMLRLMNEASISKTALYTTFTTRPTTGDLSLFGYCLSQITQSYDPQYVIGYDTATPSNEVYMPQSQFLSFWQSTFSCGTTTLIPTCSSSYQLNQVITIDKGINYLMDSVIGVVNTLAQTIYNCPQIVPYLVSPIATMCTSSYINGGTYNTVMQSISYPGLTGQVQFGLSQLSGTIERSLYRFDYFQFNGTNFRRFGNWSTPQKSTSAGTFVIATADATMLSSATASVLSVGVTTKSASLSTTFTSVFNSDPLAIGVNTLAALGLALSLGLAAFVFMNQSNPVIKRASPLFCGFMLFGFSIIYIDLFLWSGVQTQSMCISKIWIPILGFSIILGPMLAKTFRIWKIFDNSKLRTRRILTSHLLTISGVAVAVNLVLLIIWTAVDPLVTKFDASSSVIVQGQCVGSKATFQSAFKIVFIVYNSFLVMLGSVMSVLTRNVNSSFNESKNIAAAMYSLFVALLVLLPTYFTSTTGTDSASRTYLIRSAAILFANTTCLLILFVPKVYHVLNKTEDRDATEKAETTKKAKQGAKSAGGTTAAQRSVVTDSVPMSEVVTTQGPSGTNYEGTRIENETVQQESTKNLLSEEE